jgi:hypothetical protein
VSFSLPGFRTLKRDGIELVSDFTATVNVELAAGSVDETVNVTAESPVVDTQNITTSTVMTREVLDIMPTARNIQAIGIMIPGTSIQVGGGGALSRDVGGSGNLQQSPLAYKGSGDTVQTIDGMRLNNLCGTGQYSGVYWNDGSFQEISYITGADSAEMGQGGVRVNMVPREGGNTFHGSAFGNYTYGGWQAQNLRSNLAGDLSVNPSNTLTNVSVIKKIWDFNPSFGGPIKKDKLWFYFTFRHWGVNKTVADSYYNSLGPTSIQYVADTTRPGIDDGHIVSGAIRLSWQITKKDKLTVYHDDQRKYRNHWGISASISPEAAAIQVTPTSFAHSSKWTRTQSPKLFFEAGFAMYDQEYTELYQPDVLGSTAKIFDPALIAKSTVYSITELTTGKVTGAWNAPADHFSILRTYSGAVSYSTGRHYMRFGGSLSEGPRRLLQYYTGDLTMTFSQGLPQSVTLRTPLDQREGVKGDLGLYAQDKWTIGRATLNLGIRYDWFRGQVLDETLPASRWNPAVNFSGFQVQNWKDINPRIGISYDLFGDGKTAVKTSIARYVNGETVGTAAANNPETTIGRTDTRTWTDLNHDFTIFNSDGSVQTNELGPTSNVNFGKVIPSTTTTDPGVLNGWGKRGYNWEYQFAVQREIIPGVSAQLDYFRRSFGNIVFTDNLLTPAATSYDGPFCITAPSDPNLPNGGGYPVCGLYDIKPTSRGLVQNVNYLANGFGGQTNVYSGFDVSVNLRYRGTVLQGGVNAQRHVTDTCKTTAISNPETVFCHQVFPVRPDWKLIASHRFPWQLSFSGTYQFSQGQNILATWAAPNSVISGPLGRNLAAGATATKTVNLIEPGKVWGPNLNQLDLRLSKGFKLETHRVRVDADLYNVSNSNWPFTLNNTFSTAPTSQWLRPTNVLQGRLFKLGAQFDF